MQPFTAVESSGEVGEEESQAQPERQTDFRARDFAELIDEDKRDFVRRRFVASVFGGYRTVINEESQEGIGCGLHLAQIALYLICPVSVTVAVLAFPERKDRLLASLLVGGLIPFLINLPLSIAAKMMEQSESQESFQFLIPAKTSWLEVLYSALITYAYGALMTYMFHPTTVDYWTYNFGQPSTFAVSAPYMILVALASYSLFSKQSPEIAIYLDNTEDFDFGSSHYQRAVNYIVLAGIMAILEATRLALLASLAAQFYNAFIIMYFLQVFGALSNFWASLMWLLEQVNVHVLGGTARASDARIVLSFIINAGLLAGWTAIAGDSGAKPAILRAIIGAHAWINAHNFLFDLGIKKAFEGENEAMLRQRRYADIVFANAAQTRKMRGFRIWPAARFLIGLAIVVGIAFVPYEEMKVETSQMMIIIALSLTGVTYLVAMASRHTILRIIPCLNLGGNKILRVVSLLLQALTTITLVFAYNLAIPVRPQYMTVLNAIQVTLTFRALSKAFHDPMQASIDSIILLTNYNDSFSLFWFAFLFHRATVLLAKLDYALVSLVTAVKNKKQRFASQAMCFVIQYTILLPVTLGVLVITALLDTATVPFLGFAFFVIGYPKPLRGWSSSNPAHANPNGERSDGHLYHSMLDDLSEQLQSVIDEDPFSFCRDRFYMLKNSQMIMLVQVLERGSGFVVISVKGTELLETTICHAEELQNINNIDEDLFERGKRSLNYAFALSPIRQLSFNIYDDSKPSLTGIIESPEFEQLVKKAFLSIIMIKLKDRYVAGGSKAPLYPVQKQSVAAMGGGLNESGMAQSRNLFNRQLFNEMGLNRTNVRFSEIPRAAQETASTHARAGREGPVSNGKVQPSSLADLEAPPKLTFLEQLQQDSGRKQQQQPVNIPSRRTQNLPPVPAVPTRARDAGASLGEIDELELAPIRKVDKKPQAQPQTLPVINQAAPQQASLDDLDDLEDFEGGDDIDDLLDEFEGIGSKQITGQKPSGDLSSSNGMTRLNPSHGSAVDAGIPMLPGKHGANIEEKNSTSPPATFGNKNDRNMGEKKERIHSSRLQSRSGRMDQELHDAIENDGSGDIENFIHEAYALVFGDEYQNLSTKLSAAFSGQLKATTATKDFARDSTHIDVLHQRYIVLQAARLAFHFAYEQVVVYYDFDLPADTAQFETDVRQMESEWFLGGETYLWNAAIARHLPNLERLVAKKEGGYVVHRLKHGQQKDSTFGVFEFRREVVRGIWANINMELLYTTNNNDERFSIQAEKDILRNLLVQLAEVPLGYPVYSSGAQVVLIN